MRRLRLWLRELSLSQQLLSIIFLVISLFVIFVLAVLSPQIDSFTENEMFRNLESSHETIAYFLSQNPDSFQGDETINSSYIVHTIYDQDDNTFYLTSSDEIPTVLQEDIILHVNDLRESTNQFKIEFKDDDNQTQTVYYTMSKLNDGNVFISYMPGLYESEFRAILVNNIVNLNMMIALALFVILTLWMATLILPLNQIKAYITKIKNDEPATLTVNRRDEIGEVADALREMENELAKQNREKEEMIQNISHDLKTPIATIRSYSESIKDGIYPYGTLEKSIDVILEHADRLDKKVRSLIALNKMGYLLDDCEEGDHLPMGDVIDKVLLSLKVIRPEIRFETEVDRSVMFHGDEDPWRIVVENLVDNALRYAKSLIRIELKPNEIIVYNDGNQISADRIDSLFKPYEKGTDGQFGLGLSIVYRVVTTYGYKVRAENQLEGVSFRVWKEPSKKELRALKRQKSSENNRKTKG